MTPGPSARRRKRRLLYKVKSSKARDGSIIYSCIFSCLDDVEHHRHRRNPFDPKYIQAALSSFDELIRDDCARIPTREEVEAASTSVHVRMELIKSMKDGLVKLTGEAVRCFRAVSKRSSNQRYAFDHEDKSHVLANVDMQQHAGESCDSFKDESIKLFRRKFGHVVEELPVKWGHSGFLPNNIENEGTMGTINIELSEIMNELGDCLHGNANFVSEDELRFDIYKEKREVLHDLHEKYRTRSDLNAKFYAHDDLVDLSAFKCFIPPITKDIILDFEASQVVSASENTEVCNNKLPSAAILEQTVSTKFHETEQNRPIEQSLTSSLSMNFAEAINHSNGCAISLEQDDISSPVDCRQDFLDISFSKGAVDFIDHEEDEDNIEDGEEMETDINGPFCPQDRDIERFRALSKQYLKRSKHCWLVQNPEKLLLPASIKFEHEQDRASIEDMTKFSISSQKVFRDSLCKLGVDLIDYFQMLQEDPSQIAGTFFFQSSTKNIDDLPILTTNIDDDAIKNNLAQELGLEHMDRLMVGDCPNNGGFLGVQPNPLRLQEKEMSDRNFSWPIWMVSDTYQKSNCRVSAEQKGSEMSHQDCFIQEECATELIPVCEHNGIHVGKEVLGNLSSLRWMAPACTQAVSNVFPAYTLNAVGIAENVLHHLSCSSGIAMTDSDSAYNQSAEVERNHGGFMKSNHTSDENGSAPVENTVNTHDLVSAVEEQTGLQSRILPSNDPHSFFAGSEIEHVYVPTEDDSSSNKKDQKQELHQESNSCFLSSEITSQKETSRLVEGGLVNDQTCQELRQKLSLEELISSAISAECQIQKASSHYDLQRLSQLLTEQMISIYGKEKSSSILLSDLVHACAADTNVAAQRITLQRYFAALLNATHQHNLRLLKHSKNMEGCQILLQENESEKLSDVKIRLLSLKD